MSGYRDETETLRAELRQTSLELSRANAELMKREPRAEIEYRDPSRNEVHEWVVVSVLMLLAVSISTLIAALLLSGRAAAFAGVVCTLSTALMLRIWVKALPRVKVKR